MRRMGLITRITRELDPAASPDGVLLTRCASVRYLSAVHRELPWTKSGLSGSIFEIANPARPGTRRVVRSGLVDTGAELSWVPADLLESIGIERYSRWSFRQANGTVLERWVGAAFI
jgi:hypothetical protein